MTGGCFSIVWIERLLIWLVVLGAVVAILQLILPRVLAQLGIAVEIIRIVIWAVICIAVIVFAFDILLCLRLP